MQGPLVNNVFVVIWMPTIVLPTDTLSLWYFTMPLRYRSVELGMIILTILKLSTWTLCSVQHCYKMTKTRIVLQRICTNTYLGSATHHWITGNQNSSPLHKYGPLLINLSPVPELLTTSRILLGAFTGLCLGDARYPCNKWLQGLICWLLQLNWAHGHKNSIWELVTHSQTMNSAIWWECKRLDLLQRHHCHMQET